MADEPRRSFHAPPESTCGVVVKASTKPWPRRLGSSIIRALPPLGQAAPGQVRSSSISGPNRTPLSNESEVSDNWRNHKYLLVAMPPHAREVRWPRWSRSSRRRPPHVVDTFTRSSSRDRAQRRRAARRCLASVLVAARRGAWRRRGRAPLSKPPQEYI